jgi:hypothetical protein
MLLGSRFRRRCGDRHDNDLVGVAGMRERYG